MADHAGVHALLGEVGQLDDDGLQKATAVLGTDGWDEAGLWKLRERCFWLARAANSELERRRMARRVQNGE